MTTPAAPLVAPPPPKPPPPPGAAVAQKVDLTKFTVTKGTKSGAKRVGVYGPPGIGKSSLAALAKNPVIVDLELGTRAIDCARIDSVTTFAELRALLQSPILDQFGTIVIDSASKVEDMIDRHILATIPKEKGGLPARLSDYGFGKEQGHRYDQFLLFLQDLDLHIRAGRHVIVICHSVIADVPNPTGDNFIRWEPRVNNPKSGKQSSLGAFVSWLDDLLFLGYDVAIEEGKGRGSGTRTIWGTERPDHMAKSRPAIDPLPFTEGDSTVWNKLGVLP